MAKRAGWQPLPVYPFGVLTQDSLSCQRKSPQNRRNVSALSQAWRLYAQILSVSSGTAKV